MTGGEWAVPYLLGIMGVLVVGIAILVRRSEESDHRRQEARLHPWLARHGWTYQREGDEVLRDVDGVGPLRDGRRSAYHLLRGRVGAARASLFQLEQDVGRRFLRHSVLVVDAPARSPGLTWAPEDTPARRLDREDIDFESGAFSRRFWVRCHDRRFAHDVMHPRMMEYLMRWDRPYWDWSEYRLRVTVPGRLDPLRASMLVVAAEGFLERVPRHLRVRSGPASWM